MVFYGLVVQSNHHASSSVDRWYTARQQLSTDWDSIDYSDQWPVDGWLDGWMDWRGCHSHLAHVHCCLAGINEFIKSLAHFEPASSSCQIKRTIWPTTVWHVIFELSQSGAAESDQSLGGDCPSVIVIEERVQYVLYIVSLWPALFLITRLIERHRVICFGLVPFRFIALFFSCALINQLSVCGQIQNAVQGSEASIGTPPPPQSTSCHCST